MILERDSSAAKIGDHLYIVYGGYLMYATDEMRLAVRLSFDDYTTNQILVGKIGGILNYLERKSKAMRIDANRYSFEFVTSENLT